MKITKGLVVLVFLASLVPALYFSINEYIDDRDIPINILLSNLAIYLSYSLVLTNLISIIVYFLLLWLQKKYPWSKNVAKRLIIELISTAVLVVVLLLVFKNILDVIIIKKPVGYEINTFRILLAAILMTLILLPISEGIFFFQEWRESFIERKKLLLLKEQLEKEQIISQNETLKNQINPHFLFNSLNVLSALIHEDVNKAEEFIEKFANIYRYVLEVSGKQTVSLKEELNFLNSYFFLQKIRFGNNLKIVMDMIDDIEDIVILPLSLELLVENAVKHNKISKEFPLFIRIEMDDNYIIVKNNLQIRNEAVASTGIGLRNIRERYFLYNKSAPIFEQTKAEFIGKIPLLKI